jgi:hypothetical protein
MRDGEGSDPLSEAQEGRSTRTMIGSIVLHLLVKSLMTSDVWLCEVRVRSGIEGTSSFSVHKTRGGSLE